MKYLLLSYSLLILFCFLLITSCMNHKKDEGEPNVYVHEIVPYNIQNEDSISYQLWYAKAFLLPKDKIPQLEIINRYESTLNEKIHFFKDSLIMSIKEDKIPLILDDKNRDISLLTMEYLKKGDINAYCKLNVFSYPISLYMAEIYSFIPAYTDTFYGLLKLSRKLKRDTNQNRISFDEGLIKCLRKEEQDLAIYCLIKSYKNGNIDEAQTLAYYFREGIYFKKDSNTANILDSIYENRPLLKFKQLVKND